MIRVGRWLEVHRDDGLRGRLVVKDRYAGTDDNPQTALTVERADIVDFVMAVTDSLTVAEFQKLVTLKFKRFPNAPRRR